MELVTDRTKLDVLRKNEKGVYSHNDLNRVETAVGKIAELMPSLGTSLDLIIKTDWGLPNEFSVGEWPVASQMQRYLGNVAVIKETFGISLQIPESMSKLTWIGANDIEKVLQMAMDRAANTISAFRYSGEIYSGEE